MLFEKALSSIGKENEELNKRYEKGVAEYKKAKKTYNKLPENQREKWLKENDWQAKDFADDVMGYDKELDIEKEIRYALRRSLIGKTFPYYGCGDIRSEANERATRWAHEPDTKSGDIAFISYDDAWYEIEAFDDLDSKYQIVNGYTEKQFNEKVKRIKDYGKGYRYARISNEGIVNYENENGKQGVDNIQVDNGQADISLSKMVTREYAGRDGFEKRKDNSTSSRKNLKVKFSLSSTVEKDATNKYGNTYNWRETGYILTDGTRLDLSGKRQGATGGRRTVDHRDIFEDYEDISGTDAMVEFMSRGNIRVSPEYPGINIQVEPNAEQYRLIQDLVERIGWKDEYFSVDFDNEFGDVVETLTYEGKVSGRKVVSDIKYYFKEGKLPHQSELSRFMLSKGSSDGLYQKKIADISKKKVYAKKEALEDLNSILVFEKNILLKLHIRS